MQYQLTSPRKLFNDLNELVKTNESFYITEQTLDNARYFIYNYRLCSYSEWLNPGAFNARGTMFQVDMNGEYVKLVCLPFHKFFNNKENPFVMDLDFSLVDFVCDKMDGSLISTFLHNSELRVKTKGSLFSEQAVAAGQLLHSTKYKELYDLLVKYTANNCTVNLEYTAPNNRIVIGYAEPNLTVLGVRDNVTGSYVSMSILEKEFGKFCVKNHISNVSNVKEFVESIPAMTGIEGFVIRLINGIMVKIKTDAYVVLHKTKDSINSQKKLFECVVNETSDDLRALFYDDAIALQLIDDMQAKVIPLYNSVVKLVETFYNDNKTLDRKSYAIKGTAELERMYFGLAMNMYIGKIIDYKEFMVKHYKDFGIKDDIVVVE